METHFNTNHTLGACVATALVTLCASLSFAAPTGTAFTYQGRLNDGASPANGSYDLRFAVYGAVTNGGAVAGVLTNAATVVSDGLFTVTLDFGPGVFDGRALWLEMGVRTNGFPGAFIPLLPRQAVTATPYASYAPSAGTAVAAASANAVAAANVSGTLALNQLPGAVLTNNQSGVTLAGSFAGNGAGLSNMDLRAINAGGAIQWITNFAFGFSPAAAFNVGNAPHSVAVGDVNGDGRRDLVSANAGDNTLTVLTNNGAGGFGTAATCGVGSNPNAVALADVNNDGRLDLISANTSSGTLTVLTNNGAGFGLAATPTVGSGSRGVASADVNGDGWVDLVSANTGANTLSVLTNNGSGGFAIASSPGVGNQPYAVVAADVNGDGRADLISANFQANTLTVLTNNGSGGFVIAASPGVGNRPYGVAAADINGDGKVDLISADAVVGTLTVLTNSGQAVFVAATTNTVGGTPLAVTAADLNQDGWADLISANNGTSTLTVLTNNGHGLFVPAFTNGVGAGPWSVVAADVHGDGGMDLITANAADNTLTVLPATPPTYQAGFAGSGAALTSLNATNLTGTLADTRLSSNVALLNSSPTFQGTVAASGFTGNGSGLTALNASALASGTVPIVALGNAWKIGGNTGTAPSTDFIGTIDNQPLEFRVNGSRALRLEPNSSGAPNVIEGSPNNFVASGLVGATIGGGGATNYSSSEFTNSVTGDFGTVSGGAHNTAYRYATVGGGSGNTASSGFATVGGGSGNAASSGFATVGGGSDNAASGLQSVVGGGLGNSAKSDQATVGGGSDNSAKGIESFVGGGSFNMASGDGATVGGGFHNKATGYAATVGGGNVNTASGDYATVSGGEGNTAAGQYSFAAGKLANALHRGSFVWADSRTATFSSTADDQFLIRASGGVGIGTNGPAAQLDVSSSGGNSAPQMRLDQANDTDYARLRFTVAGDYNKRWDMTTQTNLFVIYSGHFDAEMLRLDSAGLTVHGTFVSTSDRNAKENFTAVSPREVLDKVAAMPITRWNYKGDKDRPHLGPVAQDFRAAFGLGTDDKHIATVDADGVALAAIQGLNQKLEAKDAELQTLKQRLTELENLVRTLAEPKNGGAQ